jgi:hypothetical protein
MSAPRPPRPLSRGRQLTLRAAAVLLRVVRRRRGPWVDDLGFPTARHPEDVIRELPEADEEWLGELAAVLWPDDEYAEILRRDPPLAWRR